MTCLLHFVGRTASCGGNGKHVDALDVDTSIIDDIVLCALTFPERTFGKALELAEAWNHLFSKRRRKSVLGLGKWHFLSFAMIIIYIIESPVKRSRVKFNIKQETIFEVFKFSGLL